MWIADRRSEHSTAQLRGAISVTVSQEGVNEDDNVKYIVEILLKCAPQKGPMAKPRPAAMGEAGEYLVVPVMLELLNNISAIRIYTPKDLRTVENRVCGVIIASEGFARCAVVGDMEVEKAGAKGQGSAISRRDCFALREARADCAIVNTFLCGWQTY